MQKADYSTEQDLPVVLYSITGVVLTGLVHGDISLYYKKYGDTSWATKTLNAANWREDSGGMYYITFTASETDTYGRFVYYVRYDATNDYGTNIVLITDWETEASQLQDIYDLLAAKVNKSDILDRERRLDQQVDYLAKDRAALQEILTQLQLQVSGLRYRIAQLP